MCFVQERSERLLVTSDCAFSATNLVSCDSVGYILDESVQRSSVILVPQELQKSVLFRKRFEHYNDIHQSPTNILRERDDSECEDLKADKPAKQFPPLLLRMITFSCRRFEYIGERQYSRLYRFDLLRIAHGPLGHESSTKRLNSYWDGTHVVVLD